MKWICGILFFLNISTFPLTYYVTAFKSENVLGGHKAWIKQFPYVVSIIDVKGPFCGGSIIDEGYVLTAAHCVCNNESKITNNEHLWVVAGTDDPRNQKFPAMKIAVQKIYVPTDVDMNKFLGDIAVLKLQSPLNVENNDFIQKINLDEGNKRKNYKNKVASFAGFGCYELGYEIGNDGQYTGVQCLRHGLLHFGTAVVLSNDQCQKKYSKRRKIFFRKEFFEILDSHLCTSLISRKENGEAGNCQGDSGSPIVIDGNIQIGVFSFGSKTCNDKKIPSVSIRVSAYTDFINKALADSPPDEYIKSADLPLVSDEADCFLA